MAHDNDGTLTAGRGARPLFSVADAITLSRIPLAVSFLMVDDPAWRLGILGVAAATDLLDGFIARRFGASRFGPVIDPVADKLFMACAFAVVFLSGALRFYEVIAVLARDLAAVVAVLFSRSRWGRVVTIPARLGGKVVTVLQLATLLAFLLDSTLLRPLTWATGAVALYAIWDYYRVAPQAARPLGKD